MSKQIKLEWQDEANNETFFNIYRGTSLGMVESDSDLIIRIVWNGSSWDQTIWDSTDISALSDFLSGGNPEDVEGAFSITFIDAKAGTHYYGVLAGNSVAKSDIVPSTSAITI